MVEQAATVSVAILQLAIIEPITYLLINVCVKMDFLRLDEHGNGKCPCDTGYYDDGVEICALCHHSW